MENFYEINQGTLCLLKKDEKTTEVFELNNNYIIKNNINKIILDTKKNLFNSSSIQIIRRINIKLIISF